MLSAPNALVGRFEELVDATPDENAAPGIGKCHAAWVRFAAPRHLGTVPFAQGKADERGSAVVATHCKWLVLGHTKDLVQQVVRIIARNPSALPDDANEIERPVSVEHRKDGQRRAGPHVGEAFDAAPLS